MMKMKIGVLFLVVCFSALAFAETGKQRKIQQRLQECQERCEKHQPGQEKQLCQFQCKKQFGATEPQNPRYEENEEEEQSQSKSHQFQQESPYVFKDRHFLEKFGTEHGRISVLQKFTDKSELLRGLENFRLGFLIAEPQTFIVPNHLDADGVFFVVKGRGTITQIRENKRESFNIKAGNVIRLEAGTPIYMINQDQQQQLFIVKLLKPVANPGEFEAFYGGGGENPESFYSVFSMDLLEAALQTRRDQLERLFGQQKQGVIIKASREQIQALSKENVEGGVWPSLSGETKGRKPFDLFEQEPSSSNEFGKLFEAFPEQYRQLRDVNVAVSFANITEGAMMGPLYNSKATKIVLVTNGEGYFEMACPHLTKSRQFQHQQSTGRHDQGQGRQKQHQQQPTQYQKVSSRLQRNTVFIIPAGHPVAIVASNNQNLQLVCFGVNAFNNEHISLAGKNNIINKMQSEAKELAFSMPAREVDKIFKNNDIEELFFPGPGQQKKSSWSII